MWYRYETHMHSREGSACGRSSAADMVRAYHAAGYAGAVLTDHFIFGNTAVPATCPGKSGCSATTTHTCRQSPRRTRWTSTCSSAWSISTTTGKELLIYGVDVAFWKANPDIPEISVEGSARASTRRAASFPTRTLPFQVVYGGVLRAGCLHVRRHRSVQLLRPA